jgi:multidrug efflux pump
MLTLIRNAIKKFKITFVVTFMILAIGVYSFIEIPKQDMPDIVPPLTTIEIIAPGYALNEVEALVVSPIENAIQSIDGVDNIVSVALNNIAIINVILDINETNTQAIFDRILREISSISLPEGVYKPTYSNMIVSPHAVFGVSSDSLSFSSLTDYATELSNRLSNVANVSSVSLRGDSDQIVYVDVDPLELNKLGITLQELMMIVNANGLEIPIGSLTSDNSQSNIIIPVNYENIQQLQSVLLKITPKGPVTLGDISYIGVEENRSDTVFIENNSKVVFIELFFDSGIDFTILGNELNDVQSKYEAEFKEVKVNQMTFQPDTVKKSLSEVYGSLILGVILVFLVVLIGLGFKNALSVAFTLPLIILGTIASIFGLGMDLQKITIAGLIISIGIVVDNSIVISESIQFNIDKGLSNFNATISAVKENSIPILSSSLTTIAAFIPFMVIGGVAGVMIRSLPITVSIAIGISYIIAMIIMPTIGAKFFKPSKLINKKRKKYPFNPFLKWSITHPKTILSFSLTLLFVSVLFMTSRSEIELFPVDDNNIVYVDYEYKDINDKIGATYFAESIVELFNDVDEIYYTAYSVGGDLPAFDARTQINNVPGEGRILFRLDVPYKEIKSYVELFNSRFDSNQSLQLTGKASFHQLTTEFSSSDADIAISLSSYDQESLELNSRKILEEISKLKSVSTVNIETPRIVDAIVIELNKNAILSNGLNVIEVQQQIASNINGASFQIFDAGNEKLYVSIKNNYTSIDSLSAMNIKSTNGSFIPLTSISTFSSEPSYQLIQKQNGNFQKTLHVYYKDEVISLIENNEVTKVANQYLDESVKLSLGGQAEMINETFSTLSFAALVAIFLVFFILLVQFNSFKTPIIILLSIPLSLLGSALLVGILRTPISFTMLVGITSLIGIVVNMGILLIDFIERERRRGVSVINACVGAVNRRSRPIILSTLTTLMGLVPLAINGGAMFTPMAVSLMGGLIASTFLTLLVIPATYYLIENKKRNKVTI